MRCTDILVSDSQSDTSTDILVSDWLSHIKVSLSLNAYPTLFVCHRLWQQDAELWQLRELASLYFHALMGRFDIWLLHSIRVMCWFVKTSN